MVGTTRAAAAARNGSTAGEWPGGRPHRPLYARVLRLRHVTPSGLLCFVFFEGALTLGLLMALAELVSWWGVIVLPATVALMVKLNDVVAGSLTRAAMTDSPVRRVPVTAPEPPRLVGEGPTTRLPELIHEGGVPVKRPWAERLEVRQQWLRQSATRRYE